MRHGVFEVISRRAPFVSIVMSSGDQALSGEFLTGRSAACGFAFINSVGNLGAYFGLSAIGSIATKMGSFSGGFALSRRRSSVPRRSSWH